MSRPALVLVVLGLLAPLAAHARPRCYTPELRRALHPTRVAYAGESDRPASVGYVDSEEYPIRVHYGREQDADRAADTVLPAAERTWGVQVDEMGWPPPANDDGLGGNDSFDLYLTDEDTYGGAWTWGPYEDVTRGDDWFSVAAFVALDQRGITDADMEAFVAHEFNHALQYAIDGAEYTLFVWESTATAMEELAVPESDIYMIDIGEFNSLPFESILFDGYSDEIMDESEYSYYEYGGSIVGLFIEEAYGSYDGTTLLALWLALAQGSDANEPDYVDALDTIGGTAAPTYQDVYLGLTEYRMFVGDDDDGAHYDEGADWGRGAKVATEARLSLSTLAGSSVSPRDQPYDLGASYWAIDMDDEDGGFLQLSLAGAEDAEWGIVATAWIDSGPARVVRERGAEGAIVTAELDLTGATQVMIGIANLGREGLDAEDRQHPRADFTLSFARSATRGEDPDPDTDTDADTDADTAEDIDGEDGAGACGCHAAPTSHPAGLLLLAAALVRRRRA